MICAGQGYVDSLPVPIDDSVGMKLSGFVVEKLEGVPKIEFFEQAIAEMYQIYSWNGAV